MPMDDINNAFVRDTNFSLPGLTEGRQFETNDNDRQPSTEPLQFTGPSLMEFHLLSALMPENFRFTTVR